MHVFLQFLITYAWNDVYAILLEPQKSASIIEPPKKTQSSAQRHKGSGVCHQRHKGTGVLAKRHSPTGVEPERQSPVPGRFSAIFNLFWLLIEPGLPQTSYIINRTP